MAINGQVYTDSYGKETVLGHHHPPVIRTGEVKTDNGTLPEGLVIMLNSSSEIIEWAAAADEVLDTGSGDTAEYTGSLDTAPIVPGSLSITDGTETFSDDGGGGLTGDATGTGTINYVTGAYTVTFNANVTDEQDITADYRPVMHGVLAEQVDTTKNASANYIVHGSVRKDQLKVGATAEAAVSDTEAAQLESMGIWPE